MYPEIGNGNRKHQIGKMEEERETDRTLLQPTVLIYLADLIDMFRFATRFKSVVSRDVLSVSVDPFSQ